jgi:hypothetical protein
VISKKFNAVELYGLRQLMVQRDLRRIAAYEAEWNEIHGAAHKEEATVSKPRALPA